MKARGSYSADVFRSWLCCMSDTPLPNSRVRQGPPDQSPASQKPAERANSLKKSKPTGKQPVDEKENSDKESAAGNVALVPVNKSPLAGGSQKSATENNKNLPNRQGGLVLTLDNF